jgi:hypothetical protein
MSVPANHGQGARSMNQCPVCGYNGLDEPAYDSSGCASFDICPSCGTQFGYDDATKSHESLRAEWIAKGMPWWADDKPPPGWNPVQQLRSLTNDQGRAPAVPGSGRDDTGARRK